MPHYENPKLSMLVHTIFQPSYAVASHKNRKYFVEYVELHINFLIFPLLMFKSTLESSRLTSLIQNDSNNACMGNASENIFLVFKGFDNIITQHYILTIFQHYHHYYKWFFSETIILFQSPYPHFFQHTLKDHISYHASWFWKWEYGLRWKNWNKSILIFWPISNRRVMY